jgi:hypothetical protein
MTHVCHAHGCKRPVPPAMFMCRDHWFALRRPLRDAVYAEYRPGQENDKHPSARYMAVQRRAIGELVFRPNDERAARTAAPYLIESELWRLRAIKNGDGDPLDGLAAPPLDLPDHLL